MLESVKIVVVVRDSRACLSRPNEMYLVEDNVLEVVGYSPLLPGAGDQMAAHIERGLHQQSLERSQLARRLPTEENQSPGRQQEDSRR